MDRRVTYTDRGGQGVEGARAVPRRAETGAYLKCAPRMCRYRCGCTLWGGHAYAVGLRVKRESRTAISVPRSLPYSSIAAARYKSILGRPFLYCRITRILERWDRIRLASCSGQGCPGAPLPTASARAQTQLHKFKRVKRKGKSGGMRLSCINVEGRQGRICASPGDAHGGHVTR